MWSRLSQAFRRVRRSDLELQGLLPAEVIEQALRAAGYVEHARVYTAVTTMLTFLGQLLRADRSCQQAVSGLIAQRVAANQTACSADTAAYCKARQRLPEAVFWDLQQQTGRIVEEQAPPEAHWCGRRVRVVDGSTLKIEDTAENRAEYPLQAGLQPGTSYPLVRILVVFSLAVGTVLEAAIRPYQGKGTGETGMLRSLAGSPALAAGDVLLGDRYFAGFWDIACWQRQGLDLVTRLPKSRVVDFRTGQRLGPDDRLITWPKTARPDWLTPAEARLFPDTLILRAVRVRVAQPGFRTRVLIVLTTLLDPVAYPASAVAELYRRRWQAELNLRSLKTHLGMEQLRTKHPETVRKEFAMHLTAYNCVRRLGAEAAHAAQVPAWSISFKGALQALNEFLPRLHHTPLSLWMRHLLWTAQQLRVDRRDRVEPYATKQRPKEYPVLREPRSRYKSRVRVRR
jgi:hypothetical protein